MHVTKAFGHVAISQLPMQYLLSLKSPRSPITLATGLTHERLNAYHRIFGRIIHTLLLLHAILYIRFFVAIGVLSKRIKDRDVQLGLLAFTSFNILGLLAAPAIRQRLYFQLFYRSHVILTGVVLPILFFHVPYTRMYIVQTMIFWIIGGFLRRSTSRRLDARCETIIGTSLIKISIPLPKGSCLEDWVPGQHIYLRRDGLGPKNPFTIVDIAKAPETSSSDLQLVIRDLKGPQTGYLSTSAYDNRKADLWIEGPYGEAELYLPPILSKGRGTGQILLIAGGIGVTYTLPIYKTLLRSRGGTSGMKFIWLTRTAKEATWVIHDLEQTKADLDVDIYLTKPSNDNTTPADKTRSDVKINYIGGRPNLALVIEPLMNPKDDRVVGGVPGSTIRRDPRKLKRNYEKVTTFVCGPSELNSDLRKVIGKHVLSYGRDIEWYEEQFGFGGS